MYFTHFYIFQYGGIAVVDTQTTDLWVNTTTFGNRTNKYYFYTSQGKDIKPVRYEMMGFDSLLGSHFDKYIVDYATYEEPGKIPADKFDVPKGKM